MPPPADPAARAASAPGPARRTIDINCDLAEGAPHDAELLTLISAANLCCGVHAGSEALTRQTAALAQQHGIAIGAHPGAGGSHHAHGRAPLDLSVSEVFDLILDQTRLLMEIAPDCVRHVKPHGALYNLAAQDESIAQAVAAAVCAADAQLCLYGLAGSQLAAAAEAIGLPFVAESFADRTLQPDGTLMPRNQPGALLTDPAAAARQALQLAQTGHGPQRAPVQTICVHGDTPGAPAIVRAVRAALEQAGFTIAAPIGERS